MTDSSIRCRLRRMAWTTVAVLFMMLLLPRPGGTPPVRDLSGWRDSGHAIASAIRPVSFAASSRLPVPLEHAVVALVSAAALTWTWHGMAADDGLVDRLLRSMWTFLLGGAGLLVTLLAASAWLVTRLVLQEITGKRRSLT
jgi:hypothetical protein